MEGECSITIEIGTIEFVECGEESMARVPLICNGEELCEIYIASEECDGR